MFCWSSLRAPGKASPSAQTSAAGVNSCSKTCRSRAVVHHRVAVEQLAGVRVDEHHVADVLPVGDLDDVGQDVVARHAPGRSGSVDQKVGRGRADTRRVGLASVVGRRVGPHCAHGTRRGLPGRQAGDHRDVHVRCGVAIDRRQVTLGVEVGEQHGAEDRDPAVDLFEGDGGSVTVGSHAGLAQLVRRCPERRGVLGEVVARLVGRTQGGPRRVGGAEVAGPRDADEPDLAGRGLGGDGDRALGLGLHLLDEALPGGGGSIGGGGRLGQSDACEAGADECETTCLAEDLHLLSLPETSCTPVACDGPPVPSPSSTIAPVEPVEKCGFQPIRRAP